MPVLEAHRVIFRVGPNNRRSQRALEKIGASFVGAEQHPERGEFVVYEITHEAFQEA